MDEVAAAVAGVRDEVDGRMSLVETYEDVRAVGTLLAEAHCADPVAIFTGITIGLKLAEARG